MDRVGQIRWRLLAASGVVAALVGSTGCGDSEDVPTADELIERAVSVGELGPGWVSLPDALPRVILNDERDDLPTLDLCPDASEEAVSTASDLRWQVGSGAGFDEPGVAIPPALVMLLLADESNAVRDTFDELREAMTSCLPAEVLIPDAGEFTVTELDVPPVGDDRFGVRRRQIDQPPGSDRWDERHVIVRSGPVLLWFSEIEIGSDEQPIVDDATFDAALVAAAGRLAGGATTDDVGLANPASVYCVDQGGTVEIIDESDGQVGYCVLPDGRRIEEWEFFRSSTSTTVGSTTPP